MVMVTKMKRVTEQPDCDIERYRRSWYILLARKWIENVHDIKRISDRIMLIKLFIGSAVLTVLSVYAPQYGMDDSIKDAFYDNLQLTVSGLSAD